MLGDQNHVLANNFGVLREDSGLADRATFVVDPDGVIPVMEITSEGVGRNAEELVRKITAAVNARVKPGQVCRAKGEEGPETPPARSRARRDEGKAGASTCRERGR